MDNPNEINELMKNLGKKAEDAFNGMLSPEVMSKLSPEQKKMVINGKNAIDFSGIDLSKKNIDFSEKLATLQGQLKDIQDAVSNNR